MALSSPLRYKKETVSIVRLVYYMLVDNYIYKHVRDRRYRRYGIGRTIIATNALGELDVVDSRINQRQDMSEELLGVVSVEDDALSTSGMPWEVSRTVFHE